MVKNKLKGTSFYSYIRTLIKLIVDVMIRVKIGVIEAVMEERE